MNILIKSSNLQFITHQTERFGYLASAKLALEGGCKWIQLRMKDASAEEVEKTALQLQELCKTYGAVFILDDHVELTKKLKADGVHLGKTDMPVRTARTILGDGFIIGGTANTFDDVRQLAADGADYIGLGPFRFTETKKNLSPTLGLDGYRDIARRCKEQNIVIPIVAIGGITEADITPLLQTGIAGIALSSEILQAENPKEKTERIVKLARSEERGTRSE